ncbi:cytochrome bc complex cytochrome b subunit [Halapricum desulfuricans]|uniref:Cytochrome b subunit of the bc complex n=1 Tax=Halapricum desulfuricans TaxID=2841257 RepID=A0A897NP14_9EURY|nr:cytochrome bc complex cytochrome b subunit [Halapricum desulfuricans]QSG14174.1 Cytochrome b subunit of the bc complex [Halapricum desulfuricans]
MTDDTDTTDERTDGGGTGIVPPDDETPTWSERKARKQGLSRLTYEYFERARREDQDLRQQSSYVERDVLGFPAWPHETVRNLSLASFFVGMIIVLAATLPPHIDAPANPSTTPAVILPDWYLYWSFGLLKLGFLNPDLSLLGGEKLMSDRTYGVVANLVVVGFVAIVPFLNKGSARRPVEQPFWASVGVAGVVFAFTIAVLSIKNLVPIGEGLLNDLTFLLPIVAGFISYAVLKSMREGYMFNLNRRYYRLRPPK